MKQILLVNPSAGQKTGVKQLLESHKFQVRECDTFQEGLVELARATRNDADLLVGVVAGWPAGGDAASHAFFNALADTRHVQRAVVLLSEDMASSAIAWLKQRKRSALLLWNDISEAPAALNKLLNPGKKRRLNVLEQMADQHLRVLIVDDSPTVRIAFQRMLSRFGFHVTVAESALDGYRKALREPFDLAIIDYFMPGQNGVALVRKLRSDPNTRQIVTAIITGTYSDTVINDALGAGASECIFKSESRELFLARIASLARNIVDRKAIDSERRRLEGILRSVGDGVYGVDNQGLIQFANPAACEILEYTLETELTGELAYTRFHSQFEDGELMPRESCFLSQCYQTGNQISGWQTTFWSRTGRPIPVECTVFPLEIDGRRRGSVVAFRDVSARKQLEEELRWQATHDPLTKLNNRSHFESELERELHRLRRSSSTSAMLYVDLDRFKYINDTAGHQAGDRLLVEVAERLKDRLRISDSLARIGGDEYAVILRNVRAESIHAAAENFRTSLEEQPFHYGGKQYLISATFGVALMDCDTASLAEAMANADIACNMAKKRGRNRVHVYSAETDQKATMDMELGWSARLRRALNEDHFMLQFQPILPTSSVDFEALPAAEGDLWEMSGQGGPSATYEVLLRLRDDEGQLIAPDAFLPTAERFNMMVDIDRWVIDHAFELLARLHGAGQRVCFSINLSEPFMLEQECVDFVAERLRHHALDTAHVTFEFAEARAINNLDRTREIVTELKALGCRVGLDDFGTGFASFTHLRQLDVDFLKIDGSYLRSMSRDPINAAVLSAIAKIAHALGKETIAECVDSASVVRALRHSGIDQLQGYFIARPQAESEVARQGKVTAINQGFAS